MEELMMSLQSVTSVMADVRDKMVALDEREFLIAMCMMFDEYHVEHPGSDPADLAYLCFQSVGAVNETMGEMQERGVYV